MPTGSDPLACRAVDPVRIEYTADNRFVRHVAAANVDRRARVLALMAAALVVLVAFAIVRQHHVIAIILGIVGAFVAAAAIGAQRPSREVARNLRAQFRALPPPARISVEFDPEGLEFENAHGAHHLPWAEVRSVHRTKNVWFIHTTTDQSLPIPVTAMTPEAESVIRAHAPTVTDATTASG